MIMFMRISRQILRRTFAGACLAVLALSFVPVGAEAAGALDICKGTDQATGKTYYLAHPVECAGVCYIEIDPKKDVSQFTSSCTDCVAMAADMNVSLLSPEALAVGKALSAFTAYACVTGAKDLAARALLEATCDKGPLGCCITVEKDGSDGKGKIEKEVCRDGAPIYYGDCYCIVGQAVVPPDENSRGRSTYSACDVDCKQKQGRIDFTQGIGRYRAEISGVPQQDVNINPLCYKPEDCALDDGVFEGLDKACPDGQGKCRAKEPVITLSSPILSQVTVTGIRGWIELMFRFAVGAAIFASALMFVYGGFKYILNSSFMSIGSAKETMVNGLIGMILTLGAVALLNTVNPATTRYDQLVIHKVNRIQFSMFNWCDNYKPARPGTPLKFGESGDPPGQLLYTETKFNIDAQDTMCGKEYYVEGVVGRRCSGRVCKDKGKACFSCASGAEECGEKKDGYACVKGVIAGAVNFADGHEIKKIMVLPVCNYVASLPDQNHGYPKVKANIKDGYGTSLVGMTSGPAGGGMFIYSAGQAELDKMNSACADSGGLRGVVLGVVYKDTETSIAKGAAIGAGIGATIGFGVGAVPGAVIGGIAGTASINDVLIVGKNDCGNKGTGQFKGYVDGGASDFDDMVEAFYCGSVVKPGTKLADVASTPALTDIVSPANMWTMEDLKPAFSGASPIKCDFTLSKTNAPNDPGTNLMAGCKEGWCRPDKPKCNEK